MNSPRRSPLTAWRSLPFRYVPIRCGVEALQDELQDEQAPASVPWRLLVVCCLLNRSKGTNAKYVIDRALARWCRPDSMALADEREVAERIRPLGLHRVRARRLIAMSERYADADFDDVEELPTVGRYARDAWTLWIEHKLPTEQPRDKVLGAIFLALGGTPRSKHPATISGMKNMAEFASVSTHVIRTWIEDGTLPTTNVGGSRGHVVTTRALLDCVEGRARRG